uniref:BIRD-IDD transcription factor fourth C2HC zinc finger domain-containing protein n=1 Tax=Oryza brachyantha TaxID=4533 RepID=J3L7K6_ORYBR
MEEFEMHHQQQQQSCYSKLLLGSPLVEIANVDDGELQRFAGATSEPPPAGSPAVKKKKRSLPGTPENINAMMKKIMIAHTSSVQPYLIGANHQVIGVIEMRDSFVTHRAFCDALAQENNKLAQPMNMATVTSALQGQAAHHLVLPSQPDDAVAEDDDAAAAGYGIDADVKSPHLKMFPDDNTTVAVGNPLLPALSMAGCMLSSLGGRAATPFSPFFHGGKPGMERPGDAALGFPPPAPGSAAIMSATALLQKAAELGATTSASCYGGVGFPTVGIGSAVVGGGGLDRLPALGHNLGPFDVVPAATTTTTTQLVGFDLGGMLPGQLYGGGGAMTRAIGSLMHGEQHVGMMDRRRRGEGVRVVDYMGVDDDDDQRSFDGVGLFGPRIGPWA